MGKIIAIVAVVVAVLGAGYFWKMSMPSEEAHPASQTEESAEVKVDMAGTVYYFGAECPHCKDVMKFLDENKIADKVKFEKKEVWHDRANAAEMNEKAKVCGLDPKQIGVPFLFAEGKCYIGTPDVTGFFKKAAGM